jgi:hypothetical protein
MSGWDEARRVESDAWKYLEPFFREEAEGGQLILTSNGRMAAFLQQEIGDLILRSRRDSRLYTVELKCERNFTGNVFLETWSNRNLNDRDSHAMRGSNPGWVIKSKSDLLFYYFISNDHLYVFDLFRLKGWAHIGRNLGRFNEKAQGKYQQMNDTHGVIVPLETLKREVGFRLLHPRQYEFWKRPMEPDEAA